MNAHEINELTQPMTIENIKKNTLIRIEHPIINVIRNLEKSCSDPFGEQLGPDIYGV